VRFEEKELPAAVACRKALPCTAGSGAELTASAAAATNPKIQKENQSLMGPFLFPISGSLNCAGPKPP